MNLLSPARIKELSTLSPARMVADMILCWAVIVGAWTVVALHPAWWTVLLAMPIIGSRFYALFIIGHDGLHGRLFENRRLNNWFNDFFIMGAIGAITRINNKNHLQHHQHLANGEDPDRHKHGCFNKAERAELVTFLTGLSSVVHTIKNVFVINARRQESRSKEAGSPSGTLYSAADLLLLGGWQLVLMGGLTWFVGWWAYPVLWLAPVYLFTVLADNLRSFAEHSHPESDERADEHRLISYASNPIERFFVAPMNMNFHIAHHLWVSIPYYHLPIADREIRALPEAKGLEWRGSYFAYLWRYFCHLPLLECRRDAAA